MTTPGPALRDAGHQQVLEHSSAWWVSCARTAIETLAASGRPFSADDLDTLGLPRAHHPNAVGALFRSEALAGRIEVVGWMESRRPEARGRAVRVWVGTAVEAA